jgi:hypothetical protein
MQVQPSAPRFQIAVTADGLQALIPVKRSFFAMLFMTVWLCGWAYGWHDVAGKVFGAGLAETPVFLAVWLTAWTCGGLFAVLSLLWQFGGRELLTANAASLTYRAELFGIGLTRVYAADQIRALRVAPITAEGAAFNRAGMPPFLGKAFGPLVFDYGAKTIRLLQGTDEAEAKALVKHLAERLPRAATAD